MFFNERRIIFDRVGMAHLLAAGNAAAKENPYSWI
jgi:hypothetical protein